MRQLSSEAIVLDATDLGDRDRIVTFLAPRYGKKRGVARGARKKYSRFAGRLQLLSRVDVAWFERDQRDLVRIDDLTTVKAAAWVDGDLESMLLSHYLAEHVVEFAQEDEASEGLFRLLSAVIEGLSEGLDRDGLARYFETWVLRLAGIFPPPVACPLCDRPYEGSGAVLPADGDSLVCRRCVIGGGGQPVSASLLVFLLSIHRQPPDRFAAGSPSPRDCRQVERLVRSIRRRFLGHELRSYDVMKRTLAEVGSES